MNPLIRRTHTGVVLTLLALGCSDGQEPTVPNQPASSPFVVSSPVPGRLSASPGAMGSGSNGSTVVFVSLPPGAIPEGQTATITSPVLGSRITTGFLEGGFDPVPISARVGDVLVVTVRTGVDSVLFRCIVGTARPPVLVRTSPPPHKRDVPLNASIVVVLSTPIDESSLTSTAVALHRGLTVVSGHLEFADTYHTSVALIPDGPLSPLAGYDLVVTREIRDENGLPLASQVHSSFTTGPASTPAARLRITKTASANGDGQVAMVGAHLPRPLRVIVDSAGNPQPGVEVTWNSSGGVVAASTNVTDSDGIASASWTLGQSRGTWTATATIAANPAVAATFSAVGLSGPATRFETFDPPMPMIAGATFYPEIFAYATDQFRNIVGFSRAVTWRVISGPIAPSVLNSTTDRNGRAQIQLTSTGTAGIAVLRLEFQSAPEVFLDMTVDVRGAGAIDYIEGWLSPGSGASLSRSGHNGSNKPTVDTINAGEKVIWALPNFDYDQHRITITNGTISLTSGTWWWGQTLDSATLSTPGTYHYVDAFHSTVYGTVVVK